MSSFCGNITVLESSLINLVDYKGLGIRQSQCRNLSSAMVSLSDNRKWIETQGFVVVKILGINMFSRVFVSRL